MSLSSWAVSEEGQATASWLANGLALLAIVLAILVALYEQRRANNDKLREQARERKALERAEAAEKERRDNLYGVVVSLLDQALEVMTTNLPDVGGQYMAWSTDREKPLELRSIKVALETISLAATSEVELLLDISTATTILDATISPPGMDRAPTIPAVLKVLKEQSNALDQVKDRVILRA